MISKAIQDSLDTARVDPVFEGIDPSTPLTALAITDDDRREFAGYVPVPLGKRVALPRDDEETIPR